MREPLVTSDGKVIEQIPFPAEPGTVITFYSYKGGVGRSMALANVAALLARDGKRVLVVDWDLEAPGIEKYFRDSDRSPPKGSSTADPGGGLGPDARASRPGMVDLIVAWRKLTDAAADPPASARDLYEKDALPRELDWRSCVLTCRPFFDGEQISVISAGKEAPSYVDDVQSLDWNRLFERNHIGLYFERLRDEWKASFDLVLIDSRTGLSDSGSICTALLPDQLIVFFTANEQSINGVVTAVKGALRAQSRLAVSRSGLLVVPVPARDEPFNEKKLSDRWRDIYAQRFAEFYDDWAVRPSADADGGPEAVPPLTVLNRIYIPYASYWSFGERLPVLDKAELENPAKIGAAYMRLAQLIGAGLDWSAMEGHTAPSVVEKARAQAQRAQEEAEAKRKELEAALRRAGSARKRSFLGITAILAAILLFYAGKLVFFPSGLGGSGPTPPPPLPEAALLLELAKESSSQNAIKLIKKLRETLAPDNPDLLDAIRAVAERVSSSGDPVSAIPLYEHLIEGSKSTGDRIDSQRAIAKAWADSKQPEKAIVPLSAALEEARVANLSQDVESLTLLLASSYEAIAKPGEARSQWRSLVALRCRPKEKGGPSPECVLARCDYARFLLRNADPNSKQGDPMFNADAEAMEITSALLNELGQSQVLKDPSLLNYGAAARSPSIKEVLRVYEFLLRTRHDEKSADSVGEQIRRLDSFDHAQTSIPNSAPRK